MSVEDRYADLTTTAGEAVLTRRLSGEVIGRQAFAPGDQDARRRTIRALIALGEAAKLIVILAR